MLHVLYAVVIFLVMMGKFTVDLSAMGTILQFSANMDYLLLSLPWGENLYEEQYPLALKYAFERAMKERGEEGGIVPFSSLISSLSSKTSEHMNAYAFDFARLHVDYKDNSVKILLGAKSVAEGSGVLKITGTLKKSGKEIEIAKLEKNVSANISTPVRFQLLYDKARMFYTFALLGKPIACLKWDGRGNVNVFLKSLDGRGFKTYVEANGKRNECDLSFRRSCTFFLGNVNDSIVIKWKYCEDCDEEEVLLEKNKRYKICINYDKKKALPEVIREEIQNSLTVVVSPSTTDFLPKEVYGRSTCSNTYFPSSGDAALADSLCSRGSPISCIIPTIKERIRDKIQNISDECALKETEDEIEWEIRAEVTSADYNIEDEQTCSWGECCKHCKDCVPTKIIRSCKPCPKPKKSGFFLPLAHYEERIVKWVFRKSEHNRTFAENLRGVVCPPTDSYDACCNCKCDCKPKVIGSCSGCKCGCKTRTIPGEPCEPCDYKTLHKWDYTYSYSYSYLLKIVIKDTRNKILEAFAG